MAYTGDPIFYHARRAPSADTLQAGLNVDRKTALLVKRILTGKVDLMTVDGARKRQETAFHSHEPYVLALEACNEVLNGHGVEYLRSSQDSCHKARGIDYVNMGESYAATLTYDPRDDIWRVCSLGAYVEVEPNRFAE